MVETDGVYIMESAEIYGNVEIGVNSSIWSKAVIRGDNSYIKIGESTNIQDMCVIHPEHDIPIEIGDNVTIGHSAVIHCRRVGSNCLVGMGAILLDNAEIDDFSIVAAGTVVLENERMPPRSVIMGVPGKIVREINDDEMERIGSAAQDYLVLARSYCERQYERTYQSRAHR